MFDDINKENFIDWMTSLLLAFETFFHQIQSWFEGDIVASDWFKNVVNTLDETTTGE